MIVLENVSATATYVDATQPSPSRSPSPKPMIDVNATCPSPVASDTTPSVRTSCTSSFSPTRNSRTATPSSANRSTLSLDSTIPNADGPTTTPTAIKLTIIG